MLQMSLQTNKESKPDCRIYPERPGESDCLYYLRTGFCGYGINCRFNHPVHRNSVSEMQNAAVANNAEEYPERVGEPECQYFLKTGACKFGANCKYHHPKGFSGTVAYNGYGLPLRLGEKNCAYYMKTGNCKFGATCKFHHPEPAAFGTPVPISGAPLYLSSGYTMGSTSNPYLSSVPTWPIPSSSFPPGPQLQLTSSYPPFILTPQHMVPVPAWTSYQGSFGSGEASEEQQQIRPTNYIYGSIPPEPTFQSGLNQKLTPYVSRSSTMRSQIQSDIVSGEANFPERPDQPECTFYLKTGYCKYGMRCRFHHPKDRTILAANCILSVMGLPLRPGAPICTFYSQYGICKYGPTCKFDHPVMGALTYSPSASSLSEVPVAPFPVPTLSPLFSEDSTIEKGVENKSGTKDEKPPPEKGASFNPG